MLNAAFYRTNLRRRQRYFSPQLFFATNSNPCCDQHMPSLRPTSILIVVNAALHRGPRRPCFFVVATTARHISSPRSVLPFSVINSITSRGQHRRSQRQRRFLPRLTPIFIVANVVFRCSYCNSSPILAAISATLPLSIESNPRRDQQHIPSPRPTSILIVANAALRRGPR